MPRPAKPPADPARRLARLRADREALRLEDELHAMKGRREHRARRRRDLRKLETERACDAAAARHYARPPASEATNAVRERLYDTRYGGL